MKTLPVSFFSLLIINLTLCEELRVPFGFVLDAEGADVQVNLTEADHEPCIVARVVHSTQPPCTPPEM